jgi:hypothetical protein
MKMARAQVVHGRETLMRCKKCGGESWRVIGEVRAEERDNPLLVKSYAMRMICNRCDGWIYLDQVIRPQTPQHTPKKVFLGANRNGIR